MLPFDVFTVAYALAPEPLPSELMIEMSGGDGNINSIVVVTEALLSVTILPPKPIVILVESTTDKI